MGSLQSEAEGSPAPEVTEATSFERLLPVVLPYPLGSYIVSLGWIEVKQINVYRENKVDLPNRCMSSV